MSDYISKSPDETFELGRVIGSQLRSGDAVLLTGGLGAGKTLLTKGIMAELGFDTDEVTSPSFALVNLYKTQDLDVFHIDLWRLDSAADIVMAVGLEEIADQPNSIAIIEWADRLGEFSLFERQISVEIAGDGDDVRRIRVTRLGSDLT